VLRSWPAQRRCQRGGQDRRQQAEAPPGAVRFRGVQNSVRSHADIERVIHEKGRSTASKNRCSTLALDALIQAQHNDLHADKTTRESFGRQSVQARTKPGSRQHSSTARAPAATHHSQAAKDARGQTSTVTQPSTASQLTVASAVAAVCCANANPVWSVHCTVAQPGALQTDTVTQGREQNNGEQTN
jgi:hypothetical protein